MIIGRKYYDYWNHLNLFYCNVNIFHIYITDIANLPKQKCVTIKFCYVNVCESIDVYKIHLKSLFVCNKSFKLSRSQQNLFTH